MYCIYAYTRWNLELVKTFLCNVLSGSFINWTRYGDREVKPFEKQWEKGTSYTFSWWRIFFRFVNLFIVINQYIYFMTWLGACTHAHNQVINLTKIIGWMYEEFCFLFTFWVILVWTQWLLNFALCLPGYPCIFIAGIKWLFFIGLDIVDLYWFDT